MSSNETPNPQDDLTAVLELAAFFQDDYRKKLPVIAAMRLWRAGAISTEELLASLRADNVSAVLRYEPAPPQRGLAILNDHREAHR